MIVAGPFDYVGQIEVKDGTIDKAITHNLDRDDMVTTVMNTFVSLTVQCARCHNHKFDPILQEDDYSLQAVFAVYRAERTDDPDSRTTQERRKIARRMDESAIRAAELEARVLRRRRRRPPNRIIASWSFRFAAAARRDRSSDTNSAIDRSQNSTKWVQIDLGKPTEIRHVVIVGGELQFQ